METYYKPVFLWEGKKPYMSWIRKEIENTILANIHAFTQHINPHMNEWNEAYSGPIDHLDNDGQLKDTKDSVYLSYLYDCMTEHMKAFVPVKSSRYISEWTINSEMVLAAKTNKGALVGLYWKPVEI